MRLGTGMVLNKILNYYYYYYYVFTKVEGLILSFPWDRNIVTKQANPSLASHALKDRSISLFIISVLEAEKVESNVNKIMLSITISKFKRHIKNLFFVQNNDKSENNVIIGKRDIKLSIGVEFVK